MIKLQNISQMFDQDTWVSMGNSKNLGINSNWISWDGKGNCFDIKVRGDEIFVRGLIEKGGKVELNKLERAGIETQNDAELPEFKFSDWVVDQPEKILPNFELDGERSLPMGFFNGVGVAPLAYFKLDEQNDVRKRFKFRTRILKHEITIDGWIDIFDQQDITPIIVRCSYGTVASEKTLNKNFGSLRMFTGEKPVIDFYKAKGLTETFYRADTRLWVTEIVSPRLWWKGRTIEVFGALLCMPDYSKLPNYVNNPDFLKRYNNLKAREEGPCVGFYDSWNRNWLATKVTPKKIEIDDNALWLKYVNRLRNYGDEYNPRDYAQPPNSAQTGSQPDFGVSRGELVVSNKLPFMLHDYRFSVQAWMLRPYSHKESNGDPVKKINHPDTLLYNLAIDTRFGKDFLGFPNPVPYNQFWTASDNQHRSDNLLFAMYALTRDPSIKATIEDLLECNLMELKTWKLYGMPTSIETPRAWGRVLLSMAHAVSLGFTNILPEMNEMVDVMFNCAAMNKLQKTPDRSVRTLSNNGAKYGWVDAQGRAIRAWVCWEESIAAIGLWAVYEATNNMKAKELALEISKTITKHAFFKVGSNWHACYAVRWQTENPGVPLPSSSYNLNSVNFDVNVYGMQQWMAACLIIVSRYSANKDESSRADQILNYFNFPKNYDDSCWTAI